MNVLFHFMLSQRAERQPHGNPLLQLPQMMFIQNIAQFVLAAQYDLQQLLLGELEIAQ